MIFRPMLACKTPENLTALNFPMYASVKVDGIRAFMNDGVLYSRSGKRIPNEATQQLYGGFAGVLNQLDGELMVGGADNLTFNRTTRVVMSHHVMAPVSWHIFDIIGQKGSFNHRLYLMQQLEANFPVPFVRVLPQTLVNSPEEVMTQHRLAVDNGYEGLILRDPAGEYKEGRSTMKEQGMVKIKMFEDSEAVVLGVEEQFSNTNIATLNEVGYTKRMGGSSGLVPKGTMGKLWARDVHSGVEFHIGTGFDDRFRQQVWDNPELAIGRIAKYRFLAHGVVEKPRHPVFFGWRED